jgi:hypothetical protein
MTFPGKSSRVSSRIAMPSCSSTDWDMVMMRGTGAIPTEGTFSTQVRHGRALLLCQGWLRFQGVEDDADEQSFEAAECFANVT